MQCRNLHRHVYDFITNMNMVQSNDQLNSSSHTQPSSVNTQAELDILWNKIITFIINSCIELLLHFWVYEDKTINKKKKKKRVIPYKHTAKLSSLCSRMTRIISQNNYFEFNSPLWLKRFEKYNHDYESTGDAEAVSDKDFTIPNPPSKITQKWLDNFKTKIRI